MWNKHVKEFIVFHEMRIVFNITNYCSVPHFFPFNASNISYLSNIIVK